MLDAIYVLLVREGRWPRFVDLDRLLHRQGESDAEHVLTSLPTGLVYGIRSGSLFVQDDHEVALTVAGMASIKAASEDLELFLGFIRLAVEREADQEPGDPEPSLSATEAAAALYPDEAMPSEGLDRLCALLAKENWGWTGASWEPEWCFTFNRRVRRFDGVASIDDYWTCAHPDEDSPGRGTSEAVNLLPRISEGVASEEPTAGMNNDWAGEVLIPSANVSGYRLVYEAETWLRRICLAAFLLTDGPAWTARLDPELRKRLEDQSERNSSRWYLGVDAEEELLWSTTQGQLADLLRTTRIGARVHHLSGMQGSVLADRLRSVAQVRNALAHNRAISEDTLTVLRGDLTVVRAAVDRFKRRTLYADSEILEEDLPDDLNQVTEAFNRVCAALPRQQLFLSANEDFLFLVRLPVEPFGLWPNSGRLRDSLGGARHLLLCVLVNKSGDEVQLVMPRSLSQADKLELVDRFADVAAGTGAWTAHPPDLQHPADVAWPRLWFYENWPPER